MTADVMDVSGQTAVVTGGARGIGAAIARTLAEHGARVAVFDSAEIDRKTATASESAGSIRAYRVDVTERDSVRRAFDTVEGELGAVDILVNNAGIIRRGGLMDLTPEDWQTVISVNVTGAFNCCQAAAPGMLARQYGRIVNISSVAAKTGDVSAAPVYGTSKGALDTFTRSLARELAPHGILVNGVAPHAIETEMSRQWSEEKRKSIISAIPLRRLGKPEEVAAAVLYLVSAGASFITGEIINVNGGFLMD